LDDLATFARLKISGPDELTVDLAVDSAPGRPPVATCLGPSFDPGVLAEMFTTLGRIADKNIPVAPEEVAALRAFFAEWAAELNSAS
jgi:hypothetical protein